MSLHGGETGGYGEEYHDHRGDTAVWEQEMERDKMSGQTQRAEKQDTSVSEDRFWKEVQQQDPAVVSEFRPSEDSQVFSFWLSVLSLHLHYFTETWKPYKEVRHTCSRQSGRQTEMMKIWSPQRAVYRPI